jgi:CDP-2,3-bis-(O-geranylgeranyl)-sn-glycerol synthase
MRLEPVLILWSIYSFLPAYIANATPILFGGGTSIDFGRSYLDGRPIFGSHKTFMGFASGLLFGTAMGLVQGDIRLALLLSLGALLGDLASAFFKRRINQPPGAPVPLMDQLSFVVGAFLLSSIFYTHSVESIFHVVLITPLIHVIMNTLAYLLKFKNEPW